MRYTVVETSRYLQAFHEAAPDQETVDMVTVAIHFTIARDPRLGWATDHPLVLFFPLDVPGYEGGVYYTIVEDDKEVHMLDVIFTGR